MKTSRDQVSQKSLPAAQNPNHDLIPASLLIQCMKDEVWFSDTTGHFTLANPCACEAFALENVQNLDIQTFAASLEVFRPDGSPRPLDEAPPLRALHGESVIDQEEIVRLPKTGQLRYRLVTSSPVKDEEGKILGCVSVVHDVTDIKQAELRLEREKAFFNHLIEAAPEGIAITDKSGIILKCNAEFSRIFGYSQEEAQGKQIDDLIAPPENEAEARYLTASLMYGGTVSKETQRKRKDGRLIDVWVIGAPIMVSGREEAVFAIYRDISEKKQHEHELRKETARLKSLVSILQHQFASVQEFLNFALGQAIELTESKIGYIYHYSEEKQHFTLNTWSRDVMPACTVLNPVTEYDLCNTGFWGEVVRQRRSIINNNFTAPNPYKKGTPEGHVPLYKFMSIPVLRDGQIVGVVGLANKNEDYTETDVLQTTLLMEAVWKVVDRIKAEEALTQLNNELEKRVLQRTAALESANKELESFSYSVSHDLKAPLRAIEGFSEIFMGTYAAAVPAEGLRLLERIRQNAIHMNDLIESLLGLSRITQWQMETRMVDLTALTADIRDEMSAGWGCRDIQFDIEPGMKTSGDARLLRIILQNLISNAVKFTSRNKQAHISIGSTLNSDGQTEYFVKDNGVGFDMKYKAKLFVAFQRLHSDKDFPGTGIGLANVIRAVRRHGGTIRAEGKPEKGAAFYFTIPPQAPDFV